MPAPIALQLYTLRDALEQDFAGVVKKIANIGYVGVEPAGFPRTTPEQAGELFRELDLIVPSIHTQLPLAEQKNQVLDTMGELGCKRIVFAGVRPDDVNSHDRILRTCERLNEANAVALENGYSFGIHNHWWEYEKTDGHYPYQVMVEHLAPEVFLEIDTYWVKTAGVDPVAVVKKLRARAPLLHIKDGPCLQGEPQLAVGDGVMDFNALVEAAGATTEWMIVEMDYCATDMMQAVEKSYRYLVKEGLARGKTD